MHHCVNLKHPTGTVPITLYTVQFVDTTASILRFVVIYVKVSQKHLIRLPYHPLEDIG
jgi:hypothetical protein